MCILQVAYERAVNITMRSFHVKLTHNVQPSVGFISESNEYIYIKFCTGIVYIIRCRWNLILVSFNPLYAKI
jgi:hypothetical protein